jgi:guanylate kinase
MISDTTKQALTKLYATQNDYRPAPEITAALSNKTIVMLVGATCEGKNTVMQAVRELDSRFGIAGTRTTREPRQGDDTARYTYYPNTDAGVAPFLQAIEQHQAVQYAVNPYAHLIYGSMPEDYRAEYNLADVFSSAVANFRQLGFKRAIAITVVTKTTTWLARFDERFPAGNTSRQARRDEAIESFKWSLNQMGPDHYWVENVDGQPELAAQEVINICLGMGQGQLQAKALAASSLDAARNIAS